jgi:hypothetical protein
MSDRDQFIADLRNTLAERELEGLAKLGPQDRLGKSAADLLRGLRDHGVEFKANCHPN